MSQASIRQSLYTFFTGANIPSLPAFYKAKPHFVSGQKFAFSANNGASAVAYLHFIGSSETRITLPAIQGEKLVKYHVALVIMYQYLIKPGTPGVDQAADWVGVLDGILDGLKDRIRSDPTAGTGGVTSLFQIGEDAGDITLASQDSVIEDGVIHSWNALEFWVDEIIQA